MLSLKSFAQIGISENLDIKFLAEILNQNRIVGLGEDSHGYKNSSEIKVALIKELKQEYGFNTVIFESSFCNNWAANNWNLEPLDDMKSRIYKVWNTAELLDLFEYAQASDMKFFGCDIKGQTGYRSTMFEERMAEQISKVDLKLETTFYNLEERTAVYREMFSLKKREVAQRDSVDALIDKYEILSGQVKLSSRLDSTTKSWVLACLDNRKSLLRLVKIEYGNFEKVTFRDAMMSSNLQWLLNGPFRDEKVIVWAADSHLAKKRYFDTMIALLPDSIKSNMYSMAIKPKRKANAKIKKTMKNIKAQDYFFVDQTAKYFPEKYHGAYDGIIFCEKWEKSRLIE